MGVLAPTDTKINPPPPHTQNTLQELWLFVFNAVYSAAFFTYSVATNVYTRTHGLIRNYGLNEFDADPQFYMLKKWARMNQHAVFWLQQVGMYVQPREANT